MLAQFIRRVKALPRGRLMIIGSAFLLWVTMSLPVWRLWNYDRDPNDPDEPEHFMHVGSRMDGSGWVSFFVFWIITLELLRFFLNRPRKLERFHDRIIVVLALATVPFAVQVWWQGFYWFEVSYEFGTSQMAGFGWGVPFMIFATLAVLFSVAWSFRSTTAGGSIRGWVTTELRDAWDELRGPWWSGPTAEQSDRSDRSDRDDVPPVPPPPPPPTAS